MKLIKKFIKDESGATAIEYALIAAGVSLALLTVVPNLGATLKGVFNNVIVGLGTLPVS